MKLILCRKCNDVFKLDNKVRTCKCGCCSGRYLSDDYHAEYCGKEAIPIGFANSSLVKAVQNQPEEGRGEVFEAFIIPKKCPTMILNPKS